MAFSAIAMFLLPIETKDDYGDSKSLISDLDNENRASVDY
jgi:hypothetical protein